MTGPTSTGTVSMPSSCIASACSSNGFSLESENLRVGAELGDDVVVVGVEPLRHLHRGDVDAVGLAPARHREVGVEVDRAAVVAVALRDRADERDRVEHLVVEREVVGGDQVDPLLLHEAPVVDADLLRGREQVVGRDLVAQWPSVANLSSRAGPMRGKPETFESAIAKGDERCRRADRGSAVGKGSAIVAAFVRLRLELPGRAREGRLS